MSKKNISDDDILCQAPRDIGILEFAQARIREMEAMEKASRGQGGNNLAQQRLPRHMRRRAASHNAKRLPRRLREHAKKEMLKAGPPSSNKRPSRKRRRRPSNLLQEYNRRQRRNVWLETHIWHAKRFHMLEKWGYKIPLHPNDKGVRAAHRAMLSHCLIQDLSYYCCVELKGPEQDIVSSLGQLTDSKCGLTFGAQMYLTGRCEGSCVVYKKGHYPYGAICDVTFMWKPLDLQYEGPTDLIRQLWVWCHPAAHKPMLDAVKDSLGIVDGNDSDVEMKESNIVETSEGKVSAPEPLSGPILDEGNSEKKRAGEEVKDNLLIETKFSNGSVTVTSLKDTLVRFRLSGPQSQQILNETLKPTSVPSDSNSDGTNGGSSWFSKYLAGNECRKSAHERQQDLWQKLSCVQSPAVLEHRCIVGLTVRDPRIHLPVKRTNLQPDMGNQSADLQSSNEAVRKLPEGSCMSPLWESKVREEVKSSQIPVQEINKQRQSMLVPGSQLASLPNENSVPIILVQKSGASGSLRTRETAGHYACGWDLILPGGWAMAFWIPLVYRGARACALKELRHAAVETNELLYPDYYPDTPAGTELEEMVSTELQQKHNRIPPAKRPNYVKLGICSPFDFPWKDLMAEWTKDWQPTVYPRQQFTENNFYLLRDRKVLKVLQNMFSSNKLVKKGVETPLPAKVRKRNDSQCVHDKEGKADGSSESLITQLGSLVDDWQCLVPVSVSMVQRGTPGAHSIICLPSPTDQQAINTKPDWLGPVENLHFDPVQLERRKRKRDKVDDKLPVDSVGMLKGVKDSCERQVMGFVKEGCYSLCRGKGHGIGFVTLPALATQIQNMGQRRSVVLLRCNTSLQYRLGHLAVIC